MASGGGGSFSAGCFKLSASIEDNSFASLMRTAFGNRGSDVFFFFCSPAVVVVGLVGPLAEVSVVGPRIGVRCSIIDNVPLQY